MQNINIAIVTHSNVIHVLFSLVSTLVGEGRVGKTPIFRKKIKCYGALYVIHMYGWKFPLEGMFCYIHVVYNETAHENIIFPQSSDNTNKGA